jgi:hypothetical protein
LSNYSNSGVDKKSFGFWSRLYRDNDFKIYIQLRPSGCLHEATNVYIDPLNENQLYFEYRLPTDRTGLFQKYRSIGKFMKGKVGSLSTLSVEERSDLAEKRN